MAAKMSRAIHELANTLQLLSFRLRMVAQNDLEPGVRQHTERAIELARDSASILDQVRQLGGPPVPAPRRG